MNLTFKNYEEKDYSDLREMIFGLHTEDPSDNVMTEEKVKGTIRESVSHPEKLQIVMIRADGINVGYSIIVPFWSNEYGGNIINIDELYIKKEYRNKKIATEFMKNQEKIHRGDKTSVALQLERSPANDSAARFYERMGFEPSPNVQLMLLV